MTDPPAPSAEAPPSTRDQVYGLVVVIAATVLVIALMAGILAALGFFGCGCTTQPPAPS